MRANMAYIYWDACVFLEYFHANPSYIQTLDQILDKIEQDPQQKVVTSVLSLTEIAYVQSEKHRARLAPDFETILNLFWNNRNIIQLIDVNTSIAFQARGFIRQTIPAGYSLKPADAIHLASVQWVGVDEFHT